MHAETEAQRLLDPHQVAHRAAVSLRQAQIHSANSQCACLTTREAALRSEVALLEMEHAFKVETLEALLLEVRQECGASKRSVRTSGRGLGRSIERFS